MKTAFNPEELGKPVGPYSMATSAPPGGRLVYCAGMIATNVEGEIVGVGDAGAQTEQVMKNIGVALEAAGATFSDVVKVTTYLTDVELFDQVAPVRARYLPEPHPVSTLIGVAALMFPEVLVEIEAVAVVHDS